MKTPDEIARDLWLTVTYCSPDFCEGAECACRDKIEAAIAAERARAEKAEAERDEEKAASKMACDQAWAAGREAALREAAAQLATSKKLFFGKDAAGIVLALIDKPQEGE